MFAIFSRIEKALGRVVFEIFNTPGLLGGWLCRNMLSALWLRVVDNFQQVWWLLAVLRGLAVGAELLQGNYLTIAEPRFIGRRGESVSLNQDAETMPSARWGGETSPD